MDETRLAPRHVCLWQAQHNPICHPNLLSFPSTRRSPSILFPTFPQKGSIVGSSFLLFCRHIPRAASFSTSFETPPTPNSVRPTAVCTKTPQSELHHIVPLRRNNQSLFLPITLARFTLPVILHTPCRYVGDFSDWAHFIGSKIRYFV